jgi:hypothetical protein
MHKSATKCNKTSGKWCKNKHGASKIIDIFWTYQASPSLTPVCPQVGKYTYTILIIYVSIMSWDHKNLKHGHERYNLDRRNLATML